MHRGSAWDCRTAALLGAGDPEGLWTIFLDLDLELLLAARVVEGRAHGWIHYITDREKLNEWLILNNSLRQGLKSLYIDMSISIMTEQGKAETILRSQTKHLENM